MKKLCALVLSLCLLFGCTAALAENEITWDQVAPILEATGITGDWYTFNEISVAIFIPAGMVSAEVPSENYIGLFAAEDGSYAAVAYVDLNGMSLEDYAAKLPDVGATGVEVGTVNGLPCVSYEMPENGTVNIAFTTLAGYVLEVFCGPITSEEDKLGASVILSSIQAIEE